MRVSLTRKGRYLHRATVIGGPGNLSEYKLYTEADPRDMLIEGPGFELYFRVENPLRFGMDALPLPARHLMEPAIREVLGLGPYPDRKFAPATSPGYGS